MTNNVLIISTSADAATDDVVNYLRLRNISFYRINTEDFPFSKKFTYEPGNQPFIWIDGELICAPSSIWYRRVRTPSTPLGMDEGISNFCRNETRSTISGSLIGSEVRWMSPPAAIWAAEHKPYQLTLAAQHGLMIPRTVISNDPSKIMQAYRDFGSMIVKPARTGHLVRNGVEHAIYTSRVLEEHLHEIENAKWSTSIYQEHLPKLYDIRVTVVGKRLFAAAIDSQSDPEAQTDWRQTANPNLPHLQHTLPESLVDQLLSFMKSLNLTFGAIDLVQKPNGEYVFLEVNPNGQWLWLDDMLELGISEAVADWLGGSE